MNILMSQHLDSNIQRRYDLRTTEPIAGFHDHLVLHSFVSTAAAPVADLPVISPNLATLYKAIPADFDTLLPTMGINLDQIRTDLETIKANNVHITSIGYGGFSINLFTFMGMLAQRAGVYKPFKHITIYEDDTLTLLNAFRIYKRLDNISTRRNNRAHLKLQLFQDTERYLTQDYTLVNERFTPEHIATHAGELLFGAPDFETRKFLEDQQFLFTGHGGDEVEFISRPIVDSSITTETYGTINLTTFFLNMIKASEAFIHLVATAETMPSDESVWKFNSKEFLK
jgi:hypothetical protein